MHIEISKIKNAISRAIKNRWFQVVMLFIVVAFVANSTGPFIVYQIKEIPVDVPCKAYEVVKTIILTQIVTVPPEKMVNPTKVSENGLEFLLHYEGFQASMYEDVPGGNCTIGYGHLVHMNPCNGDSSENMWSSGISKKNALILFESDLSIFEIGVSKLVTVDINQCQFDALVSLSFNLGLKKFSETELLKQLNLGNYNAVPELFNKHIWSGGYYWEGLIKRRAAEGRIFSSCQYD
jgi:lysozyme